mmetsp:Transcript_8674/g.36346  ORF Transcript_8674/g.36346 Transcript_8674/m.36346 type:complete len:205 (-) Transcript_8674:160-774(-)
MPMACPAMCPGYPCACPETPTENDACDCASCCCAKRSWRATSPGNVVDADRLIFSSPFTPFWRLPPPAFVFSRLTPPALAGTRPAACAALTSSRFPAPAFSSREVPSPARFPVRLPAFDVLSPAIAAVMARSAASMVASSASSRAARSARSARCTCASAYPKIPSPDLSPADVAAAAAARASSVTSASRFFFSAITSSNERTDG